MTETRYDEVKAAFEVATRCAIEKMGLERFKQTSFFGSTETRKVEYKQAA